ncbi:MAG: winged helix-turn-helix domain-containing protein [Methanobrevibacter sp.]|jgi:predicted transcriptional regulator|nr:winged helix-turn-helix domain-containing protein [Methanobrevibacter sp.]
MDEIDDELLEKVAFVRLSKHRMKILELLENNIMMPSEIKKQKNLAYTHLSRYLNSLKDKELIICLNEKSKKGRYYQITPEGENVLEFIKKLEKKN